mgnify:CR=1 FL=1
MTMNTRLLLIGTGWAADSLFTYLKEQHSDWEFNQRSGRDADTRSDLVIWLLAEVLPPAALHHELQLWQVQRGKIPMLLVLPTGHRYEREWLLQLPVEGLLDQPSAKEINEALAVLSSGGRVVQLQELAADDRTAASAVGTKGLGHWPQLSPIARHSRWREGAIRSLPSMNSISRTAFRIFRQVAVRF